MCTETITYDENSNDITALIDKIRALGAHVEMANQPTYSPDFVAKVQKSKEDYISGRYKKISPSDIWN